MSSEKHLTNYLNSIPKKLLKRKTVYVVLLGLVCFTIYAVYSTILDKNISAELSDISKSAPVNVNQTKHNPHVLCIIVPYRDRFDELLEFIPHISRFLNRQSLKFHIAIINHIEDGEFRFNKGATFNAGFHIISEKFPECDYIALHDLDTLPFAEEVSYAYPGNGAYHGVPQGFHPVSGYNHPAYIGGILLMPKEIFVRINGFGNDFWGWGWEDVDFYKRLVEHSVTIRRPTILSRNQTNSFKHIHRPSKVRDLIWCSDQAKPSFLQRIEKTGLNNVDFNVVAENELFIAGFPFFVFNIVIKCNFEKTPWCKPSCKDKPTVRIEDHIHGMWQLLVMLDGKSREIMGKMNLPTPLKKMLYLSP